MALGLMTWNPWNELNRFEREMNRWLGAPADRPWTAEFPPVNVWTGEDEAVLVAELPGVKPDQLDITVKENAVTVHGKRENPDLDENEAYVRRERETGPFSRTFILPFKVDADKVTAEYHRGILEVRMPRSAEDKPKKISVTAS